MANVKISPIIFLKTETDFSKCIVCKTDKKEKVVIKADPSSLPKLLKNMELRASYGDVKFREIDRTVKLVTPTFLKENCVWRSSCFQRTTHKKTIEQKKKQHEEKQEKTSNYTDNI